MAMIFRAEVKKIVPLELRNRAEINLFTNKSVLINDTSLIQDWFTDRSRNILAFLCPFNINGNFFHCFFGFIKDPEKPNFNFCSLLVDNHEKPHGTWGRNTFDDKDFEGIAHFLVENERSQENLLKMISIFELKEYCFGGILSLCQDLIDGELIGLKTTSSPTDSFK
jgi:hypothetical protein